MRRGMEKTGGDSEMKKADLSVEKKNKGRRERERERMDEQKIK